MGCDIHVFAEKRANCGNFHKVNVSLHADRNYGAFAFLAGVRNYSGVMPISSPRGFPKDASDEVRKEFESWDRDAHTPSWLTINELRTFDYDAMMEDKRVTRQISSGLWSGACTCDSGEGKRMTWREFLGSGFFEDLNSLIESNVDRIVFWFDN